MTKSAKIAIIAILLTSQAFAAGSGSDSKSRSGSRSGSAPKVIKSTAQDVRSVEVTVYNSNLGLIKEQRKIKVNSGTGELHYIDVAAQIKPVTVHIKPLNNANDFTILEQNYEYDLISQQKLLDKYVGQKIKIVDWNEYQDRKTVVEAQLLSSGFNQGFGGGGEVYKIGSEIYLGHPGTKVLPSIPDNLISRPTLSWLYRSRTAREYTLEVSYLTEGLSWSADYIFVLSDTKPTADISGWVTVTNHSGAAYNNAKLKLMAGNVNQVQPEMAAAYGTRMAAMSMDMGGGGGFAQTDVFEYKMYDLERSTTIKDNQTKQINLLESRGLAIEREYITSAAGRSGRHFAQPSADGFTKQPVSAYISFKNTKENRLGNPLPAGTVRFYTADAKGSQQFIGEDRIDHTPKDENVRLKVGDAFDIVAERKQLNFVQRTSRMNETEWEIKIRNRKEENITVGVIEMAHGNWEITESTHKHTKIDANTMRFDVAVPKGKEVIVKYKVRVGI
ncbi:MAG: DUF4139 domain-containing protein [Chitinispirillia bacterium]|nr:DUF4139 domain-containing protein [Chitinispirillia bacterium]